jgi:hypothetical protein
MYLKVDDSARWSGALLLIFSTGRDHVRHDHLIEQERLKDKILTARDLSSYADIKAQNSTVMLGNKYFVFILWLKVE